MNVLTRVRAVAAVPAIAAVGAVAVALTGEKSSTAVWVVTSVPVLPAIASFTIIKKGRRIGGREGLAWITFGLSMATMTPIYLADQLDSAIAEYTFVVLAYALGATAAVIVPLPAVNRYQRVITSLDSPASASLSPPGPSGLSPALTWTFQHHHVGGGGCGHHGDDRIQSHAAWRGTPDRLAVVLAGAGYRRISRRHPDIGDQCYGLSDRAPRAVSPVGVSTCGGGPARSRPADRGPDPDRRSPIDGNPDQRRAGIATYRRRLLAGVLLRGFAEAGLV